MAIDLSPRVTRYECTGGELSLPLSWPVYGADEIRVIRRRAATDATLVLYTDYTVTGLGDDTATVVLTLPALAGDLIAILGAMPVRRVTSYVESGDFTSSAMNRELNRIAMWSQELGRQIDGGLRVSDVDEPLRPLPALGTRAGRLLGFGADGQPAALPWPEVRPGRRVGSVAQVRAAVATGPDEGIEALGYHQPGDGGGGIFVWRPGETGADDGGMVLEGADPSGRWVRTVMDGAPAVVQWWGARGDGVADDTAAIQGALNSGATAVLLKAGTYKITDQIVVPTGVTLSGHGGGGWNPPHANLWRTMLVRSGGADTGTAVVLSSGAAISDMLIVPENWTGVFSSYAWMYVHYPSGLGNAAIGVSLAGGCRATNVTVCGFSSIGFVYGAVCALQGCSAWLCPTGYTGRTSPRGTDTHLLECHAQGCYGSGAVLNCDYNRIIGGRYEWCRRHGVHMTAANTSVRDALIDRSGEAGIFIDGAWGAAVTGNRLSRSGGLGNGVSGLWGAAVPGTPYYEAISPDDSCHIKVFYVRNTVISSNSFFAYGDDAGAGSVSPAYIYNIQGSGSNGGLSIISNGGEEGTSIPAGNYGGYYTGYPGATPAVYTGTDTQYRYSRARSLGASSHIMTPAIMSRRSNLELVAASTITVQVGRSTGGQVHIWTGQPGYAVVTFACTTAGGGPVVNIDNVIGTAVNTAVFTPTAVYGGTGTVVITLTSTQWTASWSLQLARDPF